jgi:hypothetical protein
MPCLAWVQQATEQGQLRLDQLHRCALPHMSLLSGVLLAAGAGLQAVAHCGAQTGLPCSVQCSCMR